MNLTQLYILDAVANSESLLQAATKLHKTQPALSMALKKLEQECGFTIVDRSQYRLQFTQAGQRFYQQAQQLLHQSAQLKSLAQHLSRGAEASLAVAFDEAVDLALFLPAIRQAQHQFPHTELQLSCDYRLQALEKLKNQQVDLAISPWFPVFISLGDFETVAIGHFDILCVASPEFLQQLTEPLTRQEQLAELPQLVANSEALDFDSGKLLPLQSARRVKVNNSLCMKQALLAHLGWGMVARHQVAAELASGALVQLKPLEFPKHIRGEVHLARHKDQQPGPVAKAIWEQLGTIGVRP
ncbi:LysR family transcriptional regulator [Rheinheimera sediminis]|uniref:LysR family transcriptional regulator n=1 Tax=Rheinheimera sp. YQF-1 TaxID=2499626 RepID=UPI000FDA2F4C|nr:LysR family transcriptional regulator [Rheinheimera sp. YQF-1]RVT46872.1 LysR family transcriptional regulator [Rheinheimera sp. YQF-1]